MSQNVTLSTFEGFVSGALGACTAVTITNPMEVAKTRMQLDGELSTGGKGKVYRNVFDCISKTYKYEGIRGAQRGLGAAYVYQVALNGSRLGFYEPIRVRLNALSGASDQTAVKAWSSVAAGALSGMIGASLGNPLFLVKARMQAYSPHNPVGAQHVYKSLPSALYTIVKAEGPLGLARGLDAAILRTAMGSSVQLPSYNLAKTWLESVGVTGIGNYLLSSSFAGVCVLIMMQPADTALTRMYNQSPNSIGPDGKPRGLLYKNPIDCLYKTLKTEGFLGWYKGSLAHFLRIAPHTIITLTANEMIGRQWLSLKKAALD